MKMILLQRNGECMSSTHQIVIVINLNEESLKCYSAKWRFTNESFCLQRFSFNILVGVVSVNFDVAELNCSLITMNEFNAPT